MAEVDRAKRGFELIVVPPTPKDKGMTYFQSCFATEPKGTPMINGGLYQTAFPGKLESLGRKRKASFLGEKGGETNQTTERRRLMIKRLALICCILLLPTIAAAEGTTNYGDVWIGGQVMGVFTLDRNLNLTGPFGFEFTSRNRIHTDAAFGAGATIGYNFCMSYRPAWQRYFGVALDFQWNQFNQSVGDFAGTLNGNQFALGFLARLQYPLMGDESFTRGRWVPFLMAGPAVVWTSSDFKDFGGNKTSTNLGVIAELGLEYFITPQLSIGPSFRYRHVFGPNHDFEGAGFTVKVDSQLDQFMVLGRLAYHF